MHYTLQYGSAPSDNTPVGWCFLNVAARRWYTVQGAADERTPSNYFSMVVAMDGGLVCQYWKKDESEGHSIIVYNPITRLLKELPTAPAHQASDLYPELNLVVDTIAQQFKVFLINQHLDKTWDDESITSEECLQILSDPLLRVYDSVTNERTSPSTNPSSIASWGVGYVSSVMFQGLLYVLLGPDINMDAVLLPLDVQRFGGCVGNCGCGYLH